MTAHETFTSPPIVHCSLSIVHSPSARHYHSTLSIWLSVDPMADKYPGVSPYTYCADNPVKLVDPDGREIGKFFDLEGNYLGRDGVVDKNVYFVSGNIPNENIDENTRIISSLGDANYWAIRGTRVAFFSQWGRNVADPSKRSRIL